MQSDQDPLARALQRYHAARLTAIALESEAKAAENAWRAMETTDAWKPPLFPRMHSVYMEAGKARKLATRARNDTLLALGKYTQEYIKRNRLLLSHARGATAP